MENIILVIHLILALCLIGVVLLQRSEGGGLGIGGGGGGAMTGRSAATALGKVTWILACGFLATSITLTIMAARNAASDSVVDTLITETTDAESSVPTGLEGSLLPPSTSDAPATPPKADQ